MKNIGGIQVKKIFIDYDKCDACSLCLDNLEIGNGLNGDPYPIFNEFVSDERAEEMEQELEKCPRNAMKLNNINILKDRDKDSLEKLRQTIKKYYKNYTCPKPNKDSFTFGCGNQLYLEDEEVNLSAHIMENFINNHSSGYGSKECKSWDKARENGLDEFDQKVYANRDKIIQNVLLKFKKDKLKKFISYEEVEGNFYYDNHKAVEREFDSLIKLLVQFSRHLLSVPEDFSNFTLPVDDLLDADGLVNTLESYYSDLIMKEFEKECFRLEDYRVFIKVDYNDNFTTHYSINSTIENFAKDVIYFINDHVNNEYRENSIDKLLLDHMHNYYDAFEKKVQDKAQILMDMIEKILTI